MRSCLLSHSIFRKPTLVLSASITFPPGSLSVKTRSYRLGYSADHFWGLETGMFWVSITSEPVVAEVMSELSVTGAVNTDFPWSSWSVASTEYLPELPASYFRKLTRRVRSESTY